MPRPENAGEEGQEMILTVACLWVSNDCLPFL